MKRQRTARTVLLFSLTGAVLLAVFLLAVHTGGMSVTLPQLLRGLFVSYDEAVAVILELRFPRILIALLGGAMMAMSGVLMQAILRNPLAEPGILGVTSGAAFSAALVMSFLPFLAMLTPLFAFLGGLLAFAAVYLLSCGRENSPVRLILTGVAISACFTGLYQALDAISGSTYTGAAGILNAGVSNKTWSDVWVLLSGTAVCMLLSLLAANRCNLLCLSDKTVLGLGVSIEKTRILLSVLAVFMASLFTATVGSVSFLGLIVPHLSRLLLGSNHKVLIPYSALLGALVFLLADTIGRSIAYPYEISPAIVLSIFGGPMLIILLKRRREKYGA